MSTVVDHLASASLSVPVVRIRPRRGWAAVDLHELWNFRELLWQFVWRSVSVRYKQTFMGVAWAVIQPLLTMFVFTLFFGRLAGISERIEGGAPYSLYTYAGLLVWQLFSNALTASSRSIVVNRALVTKVYFPRLLIPIAPVLGGLVDFAVASVILVVMMAWQGCWPGATLLATPLFILLAVLTSLAVGIWLAAINAVYRDVEYTIPFLTQFWLFVTPVAYPASMVPEKWRWLCGFNPMAGIVEGFRWSLLGGSPPGSMLVVSFLITALLLAGGLFCFQHMEKTFVDVV